MSKENKKKSNKKLLIIIIAVLVLIMLAGGILAKYIYDKKKQQEMESSAFHISSNYLKEDTPSYQVVDWGEGFDINLYNYESENVALLSGTDIEYEVKASNGWICTVNNVTKLTYVLPKSETVTSQVIHVNPPMTFTGGDVTVTVTTKSPYKKVLSAKFTTVTQSAPEYVVKRQDNGTILVTIGTNNYGGTMTIKWDKDKFSPDNTNNLMATWDEANMSGALSYGTFDAKSNTTYELVFFTNESSFTTIESRGTTITIQ